MELVTKKKLLLVAGRVHPELATEISERLGVPLGDVELASFPNGERHCRYGESIRGEDVDLIVAKIKGPEGTDVTLGIKKGGKGVFGPVPMPPHPQVSDDNAKKLAAWILAM